jgi:CheY-like chemotaxis protein
MNEQHRILFVDDDEDFSLALAARCQSLNATARTAKNALTALQIAETWRPDVVCVDVEMPTANGLDVCEFLRADPRVAHATFVVVTGRTDRETIRRCSKLNARYVAKSPDTWRELRAILSSAFSDVELLADPTVSA